MRSFLWIPAFALATFAGRVSLAAITLTLSAPGSDLNHLSVGQTVTFHVTLSGLDPGETLNLLGVDVRLPVSLFSEPTVPVSGPIVPDPGGFLSASGTIGSERFASGLYDDIIVPSAPISTNGHFYSFSVEVIGAGKGLVRFDGDSGVFLGTPTDLILNPAPSGGLSVTSSNVVSEPSSFVLLLTGFLGLAGLRSRRRRFAAGSTA
jgi:hypothetical protein